MRLYILGPAFGLPSIDPECCAAVALLKLHEQRTGTSWELVASHNDDNLPRLDTRKQSYIGFRSIARHLSLNEKQLAPSQSADSTALRAFISSDGQLLLDISLYVSFENYRLRTRAAYTHILPWYANYTLPPRRRAAARSRTEHLGVSSVDMDDVHESVLDGPEGEKSKKFEHATETRARSLLGRRDTIRSLLKRPEHAGAFRIRALADAFFEPLDRFLGDNEFLLDTDAPSEADCLAFGYLSLMLYPDMPQGWLAEVMRARYPRVVGYVERVASALGMRVSEKTVELLFEKKDVQAARGEKNSLPWILPESLGTTGVVSYISRDISDRLPSWLHSDPALASAQTTFTRYLPTILAVVTGSMAVAGYWLHKQGMWPHGEARQFFGRRRLTDFGAAGAALGALGGQVRNESTYREQRNQASPVEVDVEVDEHQGL